MPCSACGRPDQNWRERFGGDAPDFAPDEIACAACGAPKTDWRSRTGPDTKAGGGKRIGNREHEDSSRGYRAWRGEVSKGNKLYQGDIDQVEWRLVRPDMHVEPVALIELTRISGAPNPPRSYFESIMARLVERDSQRKRAEEWAARLRCKAYFCAWHHSLNEFHLFNLTDDRGWNAYNAADYQKWLAWLGTDLFDVVQR